MSSLGRLLTSLGERSSYDAASQCSRCGYCEQSCPTYVATGREAFSPRGRNQLVRLMLEGGLADPASAAEALSTCLLCGACQTVCPAHVPTPDLVLEGRRALRGRGPALLNRMARLMRENPALFRALLLWGYRLKRWGLAGLAARSGLLRLVGLAPLAEMALQVRDAPAALLDSELAGRPELGPAAEAAWSYFAPCGPRYLLTRVGKATVAVLGALHGRGTHPDNPCCGLLSFNYGDLDEARAAARAVIAGFEAAGLPPGAPVVGDCSSCVAFLKSYPQLFLGDPAWRARAEAFAARVKDAVELLPPEKLPRDGTLTAAAVHDACRLRHGQGVAAAPRAAVKALAGACRELDRSEHCCGGAGAFAFVHGELSEQLLKAKVAAIADAQARVVAAASTSCLLQLERGLSMYYPECRAVHPSELVAEAMARRARTGGAPHHG
ncbi:MAG: (Fe-S)-binding protein [Elusimicrobia bacterium]|nr:(Fe-S)-binding protein [Elusimicrobiota bacterium]